MSEIIEEKKPRKRRTRKLVIEQAEQNIEAAEKAEELAEVAEAPVKETVVEETVVEETTIVEAPIEDKPTEAPVEEAPAEKASTELTPKKKAKANKTSAEINISNAVWLYASAVAPKSTKTIEGTFYKWDDTEINNRIRVTNTESNCGNVTKVLGWVDVTAIK